MAIGSASLSLRAILYAFAADAFFAGITGDLLTKVNLHTIAIGSALVTRRAILATFAFYALLTVPAGIRIAGIVRFAVRGFQGDAAISGEVTGNVCVCRCNAVSL